ncbi:MAG: nitroreductase family protein [Burkholderiales bacterium]|nr:nitroreductase family protein [Burkholderiales bacterium]
MSVVEEILDLARWAPSGDNTQPWRFRVHADDHFVVHGFDTRKHCVYDVEGRPSQMSIGALLENIGIAATQFGVRAEVRRRAESGEETPAFDVRLRPDPAIRPDPLIPAIRERAVQRRPMRTRPLSAAEKAALEQAVAPGYTVAWQEGRGNRFRMARLLFRNAKLRLIMPEAYLVHRDIIEWGARYSADRVPDQALGLSPVSLWLMRPVMKSWERVEFANKYFAGTVMPRIELDLLPGLACAAHLAIVADRAPAAIDDFVAAGRAMQRLWLTGTRLGLYLQPEMTPLIFARYVRSGARFSRVDRVWDGAQRVRVDLEAILGKEHAERAVFLARIGAGPPPRARSVRRPLADLMLGPE